MGGNGRVGSRRNYVPLIILLVLTGALAQSASDQFPPIASALQNQQFEKALDLLRPALQQSPRDAGLWTMQGRAYSGLGRKKDALTSFRTALEFSPDNVLALQGAAQIEYDSSSAAGIPLASAPANQPPAATLPAADLTAASLAAHGPELLNGTGADSVRAWRGSAQS